ncbi:MAG: 3-oxoacyl-[acyl-carrier-protein] synthase III C-terminal domain-containing protein [Bdellovibrionota bacterium]
MPSIRCIETAVPKHRYGNDEILQAAKIWLNGNTSEMALFERFVGSSQAEHRFFIQSLPEILQLGGMQRRAQMFENAGVELGAKSMRAAIETSRLDTSEVGVYIFTSCTSPVIPSIDASLIGEVGLKRTITRLPIYQHGCAGGVIGLSLANKFAKAGERVILTSVELCSLGFQFGDRTAGNLVGSAIFGDGAASVVVVPEDEGLVFLDSQSILTERSRHMMGYNIFDDGAHLRLDKELPGFLAEQIPQLVPPFLERNGLKSTDIKWWLFHPGGVKILNCLEAAFSLAPDQACWARNVLRNYGNLSSASVLFVTSEFLRSGVYQDRDLVMMVGVGPGLTVELILFELRLSASKE